MLCKEWKENDPKTDSNHLWIKTAMIIIEKCIDFKIPIFKEFANYLGKLSHLKKKKHKLKLNNKIIFIFC